MNSSTCLLSTLSFFATLMLVGATVGCSDASAENATENATDELVAYEDGPGNGSCSDAAGTIVYTVWRHEGGAPPPPGMIIGERKLVYQGRLVGHTITRSNDFGGPVLEGEPLVPPPEGHPWEVDLRFERGTKHVLERRGNGASGSEVYTQKVEGTLLTGLGPTIESNKFHAFLICQDSWNYMLP